jgi:hypothetical protein
MKKHFLPVAIAFMAAMPLLAKDRGRPVDPDDAYKNNCMRCHTSTQQYSPRVTKTILMHMRVRANLTQEEAQAILKYLIEGVSGPTARLEKQPDLKSRKNGE